MINLVRFDWAVKKLLRNKANFDILEGFLSELLGFDVKVQQILESESNKQHEEDKFNRVDILVRTKDNELMLVEIQNDPEIDYFHRILYGVSKLATEYLKEGDGYGSIQKIISISIVYFQLGQGKDYVYEYKGEFIGKYSKDTLNPNTYQKGRYKVDKISEILPKYYILKLNNFNKLAEDTLEEWIYFLKNGELPANYTAKGLKSAGEKLRVDKLSAAERKNYERYKESRWIEQNVTETAELIGQRRNQIQTAFNAINEGFDNSIIARLTGLSSEEIEDLRQNKYTQI
jgi:PD-(D/E)XK nuclease family transposase